MEMKFSIFLAAVTISLFFVIDIVAKRHGPKVAERFFERNAAYAEADLETFASMLPADAGGYAFPVLFPLDLMFMVFLGGFLGFGSVAAAESIGGLEKMAWLFSIGPALYVAADFIEDVLLARMLCAPAAISQDAVGRVQTFTKAKFATCTYAIVQTIVLSGAAAILDG
jgi:hypothetical protein